MGINKLNKKLPEERRKSLEYNKLVAYWNDKIKKRLFRDQFSEMNEDLVRFRKNNHTFIENYYTQLRLF